MPNTIDRRAALGMLLAAPSLIGRAMAEPGGVNQATSVAMRAPAAAPMVAPQAAVVQAAAPAQPQVQQAAAAQSGITLLYCGDSLAQGLYLYTQPPLRRRSAVRVVNGTRHATGLTRSDEWDWVQVARENVVRNQPDLMLAWIGANDFRPLVDRGARARYQFGTPAFAEAYGAKVAAMTKDARERGVTVAWIGLPNMRDNAFAGAARKLNEIQEAAARSAGALWVPSWDATSDTAGHFRPSLPGPGQTERRFRADDGVHFSELGYRAIAQLAFASIAAQLPAFNEAMSVAAEAVGV